MTRDFAESEKCACEQENVTRFSLTGNSQIVRIDGIIANNPTPPKQEKHLKNAVFLNNRFDNSNPWHMF